MPGDGLTHGPPATKNAGGSHHRISRINRHSLHDGFTAYNALSSETGLSCLRPPGRLTRGLMPASRHRDHTPSPSANPTTRQLMCRVHRIPHHVS